MKKKKIIILVMILSLCIINVSAMQVVECGEFENVPAKPLKLIGNVINIIKLLLPVIIIILGIVDLFKGMISQDDSKKSAGIKMFVKRLIYGVATFFVIAIVQFVFSLLDDGDSYLSCASCIVGNDCETNNIQIGESTGEDLDDDFTPSNGGSTEDQMIAVQDEVKVKGIKFTKTKEQLGKGETFTVKASVTPKNATNKKVTYKSSKKSVATITANGKITAKKAGTTTITAQSVGNKSKKATFKLTVMDSLDAKRQAVVDYAKQFIGNRYVYGGNSLTNGIDCSGFTQQVYKHFGYSLPRTSVQQRSAGKKVASLSKAKPGDLICYAKDSVGDNHVVIYMGNNKIIHASSSAPYPKGGIKTSSANYRTPVAIRRIIY